MTSAPSNVAAEAMDHAEDAVRQAGPVLKWLARLGFVSKGLVYIVVGVLATQAALGSGGPTTDTRCARSCTSRSDGRCSPSPARDCSVSHCGG